MRIKEFRERLEVCIIQVNAAPELNDYALRELDEFVKPLLTAAENYRAIAEEFMGLTEEDSFVYAAVLINKVLEAEVTLRAVMQEFVAEG